MKLNSMRRSISVLVLTVTLGGLVALTIPDVAEGAPGARGGARGGGGAMRSGTASRGSVRSSRSNQRSDRADHRRDTRRDVADNRREVRQDVRKERHEFREDRVRRYRGRHLTRAAFASLSCRSTVVIVNGITYYSCGSTYYERVYQGSDVVYVVVAAPAGY